MAPLHFYFMSLQHSCRFQFRFIKILFGRYRVAPKSLSRLYLLIYQLIYLKLAVLRVFRGNCRLECIARRDAILSSIILVYTNFSSLFLEHYDSQNYFIICRVAFWTHITIQLIYFAKDSCILVQKFRLHVSNWFKHRRPP